MEEEQNNPGIVTGKSTLVARMYEDYFLDYASYVILERAVPSIYDGLKPVQRRILYVMKNMDDGRYNKVANIIGSTMAYHPHGDAAIGEAMVNLGQKDLMIDCQGNWGDFRTGDSAAASRYIEARLTKFALEIAFNGDTTHWQLAYDGRKKEPIDLPMKFPLLLAQGVEGIAVGLSTKILPHNFQELCRGCIDILRGKPVSILPDFPTGGIMDARDYREGMRGSKVRVRAKIEALDKKTLVIRELPFGVTVSSLIESIIKAADRNKIKIKKVADHTSKDVDIRVELQPGVSPDVTIDALYAVTDCEVSISPCACIIMDDKPYFMSVNEILRHNTYHTMDLLRWELENDLKELTEKFFFSSLEKIFIEQRIYRDIEECETWEAVMETIYKGLEPFTKDFVREVNNDDITRLTEIRIKRISKYNTFEADELLKKLQDDIAKTQHHLDNLVDYTVDYYKRLLDKYGKGRERKTTIIGFEKIEVASVVANNAKLYVNRAEGFAGYDLKKDEFVMDCSDVDDIIIFRKDGKYSVTKIEPKKFVGKDILHIAVWKKGDERTTYNVAYTDVKTGVTYAKRFHVEAVTRDRDYDMGKDGEEAKIHYFSANQNGEAEVLEIQLSPGCTAKNKLFDYSFADLAIKGRSSQGNTITKYPVRKMKMKEAGKSTLGARKIWFDATTGRLNTQAYGDLLGEFDNGNTILAIYKDGTYELTNYELTNRYEVEKLLGIQKFSPETVISALYWNGAKEAAFVKRFRIETTTVGEKYNFLPDNDHSKTALLFASLRAQPKIEYKMKLNGKPMSGVLNLAEFMDVRGWKALGNKFSSEKIVLSKEIIEEEPKPVVQETPPTTAKPGDSIEFDLFGGQ